MCNLIETSTSDLKFIIITHNPIFYNVLFNEINNHKKVDKKEKQKECYLLKRLENGTFELTKNGDSPFAYHIFLLKEIQKAIIDNTLQKYHFNLLRNVFEKTATFLGYKKWKDLLPKEEDGNQNYKNRLLNFRSHDKHSAEEFYHLTDNEKTEIEEIFKYLTTTYYNKEIINNDLQ